MKKILPFILILSLLVPFLPSYDFILYAMPYTPSESENSWIDDLQIKFQTYLGNNGIVANSEWFNRDYVGGFWNDLMNYCGFEKIPDKDFASSVYDYSVQNNQSADMIFNDSSQFILESVEGDLSYFIRSTLNISDLFSAMFPYGAYDSDEWQTQFNNIKTFVNASGGPYITALFFDSGNLGWSSVYAYRIDKEFFMNDLQLYLYQSNYDTIYFDNLFGIYNAGEGNPLHTPVPQYLGLANNGVLLNSLSVNGVRFLGSNIGSLQNYNIYYGSLGYGLLKYIRDNTTTNAQGTVFVVPDGFDNFEFPIFKNLTELQGFYSGNSQFYKFNSSVDLGQYGDDINYDKLYDIIGSAIRGSDGNVIQAINNAADNYLQQQIDLLHDINNALNDGNGQSWLRRIYGLLDYNFPLTLNAFQDLIVAVQNISVSGGGGDFSEATQVLHDIDTKLGILIDEPFTDLTDDDWNSMKSRVQTKFPFCIFSDIVAISVILNRPPQQPDLNFVIPIMGTESENMVHIDLSPYEHARPYVHGVLIFVFIIGLLALSVKIFDHLKS